jgi:hypothetical protein
MARGVTGAYWVDCGAAPETDKFGDEALAAHLWRVTQEIVDRNVSVAPKDENSLGFSLSKELKLSP